MTDSQRAVPDLNLFNMDIKASIEGDISRYLSSNVDIRGADGQLVSLPHAWMSLCVLAPALNLPMHNSNLSNSFSTSHLFFSCVFQSAVSQAPDSTQFCHLVESRLSAYPMSAMPSARTTASTVEKVNFEQYVPYLTHITNAVRFTRY